MDGLMDRSWKTPVVISLSLFLDRRPRSRFVFLHPHEAHYSLARTTDVLHIVRRYNEQIDRPWLRPRRTRAHPGRHDPFPSRPRTRLHPLPKAIHIRRRPRATEIQVEVIVVAVRGC